MQNKAIEIFYLFFQGILVFQVLVFMVLFFITLKKDMLYYSLFLFFAAAYFFINAPYTFFGIPEEAVFKSSWYDHVNIPVIITENLFYLLFLKTFFKELTPDKKVTRILNFTLFFIPFLVSMFIILSIAGVNKQSVFYTVKLISVLPALAVTYVILKRRLPFALLVANGLTCTIAGTCITVIMIALGNNGIENLFTTAYPLLFIRLGLLGDMIFYLAAILKKWHYQENQLTIERLQSQLLVEKLRNKISGELHDDLGGNLSGISMYSYMLDEQISSGKYAQAKESLNIIRRSVNEVNQSLRELVWTIDPGKDTIRQLFEKLGEYASEIAAAKSIQVKTSMPENISTDQMDVEHRRNIYLLCKEAINNAVKYSEADLITFIAEENEQGLKIIISDNGKGFDIRTIQKGNGINNMEQRALSLNASLSLQSVPNKGTKIILIINSPKRG